jgi:hypothetical protein
MSENAEIDLKHYRPSCKGCQFVNLSEYDNKCPYYTHPKHLQTMTKCFFRTYVTKEQLMITREFVNSQKAKTPKEIKKFLESRTLIEEKTLDLIDDDLSEKENDKCLQSEMMN